MNFKKLCALIGFFMPFFLAAQTNFLPAYIIKITGDTLHGEVDYRREMLLNKKCRFKTEAQKIIEYTPNDISGYRLMEGKYYVSRTFDGEQLFLEYLISGEVSIYYLQEATNSRYFLSKPNEKLIELPYEQTFVERDGKKYLKESTRHIGLLKVYLQDAPELFSEIEDIREPNTYGLIQLGKNYHDAVCTDGSKCIIYEKQLLTVKAIPEIRFGFLQHRFHETITRDYHPQFGAFLHLWLPPINKNLYFRLGIERSRFEAVYQYTNLATFPPEYADGTLYKIPVHIEYIMYKQSVIRPRVALGANFYTNFYTEQPNFTGLRSNSSGRIASTILTPSLEAGVNVRLSKQLYLSAVAQAEFNSSITNELFGLGTSVGLFLDL